MLNCREVTRLVSESQERPLRVNERMGLRLHLMMCSGCRNFERQMAVMRSAMREFAHSDHGQKPPGAGE
ncbi:MAG TPA: zf-HC2 domain-containing protein [Burkholderiaceae bacterium]|nr:zf-HC2 domain-containing protein [Burkholderiaceae bacterium]